MEQERARRAYGSLNTRDNVLLNGKAVEHRGGLLGIVRASWDLERSPIDDVCIWFRADKNCERPYVLPTREPFFFGDQVSLAANCNGMIPSRIRIIDDRTIGPNVTYPPDAHTYTMDRPAHGSVHHNEATVFDQYDGYRVLVKRQYYEIPCSEVFSGSRRKLADELVAVMSARIKELFRHARTEQLKRPWSALHHYPSSFVKLVLATHNLVYTTGYGHGFTHHAGDDIVNVPLPRKNRFVKLRVHDFEDERDVPKQVVSLSQARVEAW